MPPPSAHSDKYFCFLRTLRADGRTNMYGAVPYLMRAFAIDRDRAFAVVCEWLDQQLETVPLPSSVPKSAQPKTRKPRAA